MASLRLVVDLSHLLPGGANGGIKPFIFELLDWLGRQTRVPLQFIYLTRSQTHAEIRDKLARVEDEMICVRTDAAGMPPDEISRRPGDRVWLSPPPDLAWQIRGDVLYCPFGSPEFACPGIPTICLVVDVLHRDFPPSLSAEEIGHRESYFKRLGSSADAVQCNSRHVMDRLRELYSIPAERLFPIYNAIHTRLPAAARARSSDGMGKAYFFFPANAWRHKNHETLLIAYRIYRRRAIAAGNEPWGLHLTGHEDECWHELRSITETLGLRDEVTFHGFVDGDTMSTLWQQAGALVFPSLHEGFGIPLLEAMHYGVPIIASLATSLPEVGGDACVFIDARRPEDLAEAMWRVADDPALRETLIARGRQRLEAFRWDHEAAKLLECICELARGTAWRSSTLGIRDDGWIGETALIGLPKLEERCQLELVTLPVARPNTVLLTAGDDALGSLEPRRRKPARLAVQLYPNGKPLRLTVQHRNRWFGPSHRRHGARLAEARLIRPDGTSLDLLASG